MEKTTEDENYLMLLGERIVLLRKSQGITQKELADRLGTKNAQIRRIERGTVNSTILMLQKISTELQIGLHELVKVN